MSDDVRSMLMDRVMGIQRAVAALPTFSEYQKAFELAGAAIHKVVGSPENGFQPTVGQFEDALRVASPEAILVTHPGSPSGLLLPDDAC